MAKAASQPARILGLDVSHFVSNSIDWSNLTANGYYFVFIKATQGLSSTDPEFKNNWERAGRLGLIRGAYHFLGTEDGANQASLFLTALKEVTLGPCDIGAALDLEQPISGAITPASRVQQATSWLNAVKGVLGKPPILYSSARYLQQLGDPESLRKYPLWIMSYTSTPQLPPNRSSYVFWQFTDGSVGPRLGQLTGVSTQTFNGGAAELFALTR